MYIPSAFREDETDVLLAASHVPVELDPEPAPLGAIRCHFALPNPQARALAEGRELLFIFQGPQGYVSPSWSPTKRRTGKVVPTLNYVAVHAYGRVSAFLDGDGPRAHLAALTGRLEGKWKLSRNRDKGDRVSSRA